MTTSPPSQQTETKPATFTAVSFRSRFLTVAALASASALSFFLYIALIVPSSELHGNLTRTVGIAAIALILALHVMVLMRVPLRLELTQDSLRILGLTWFKFFDRDDLETVQIARSPFWPKYILRFKSGKKYVLIDLWTKGELSSLLSVWAAPTLRSREPLDLPYHVMSVKRNFFIKVFPILFIAPVILALVQNALVAAITVALAFAVIYIFQSAQFGSKDPPEIDDDGVTITINGQRHFHAFSKVSEIHIHRIGPGLERFYLRSPSMKEYWEYDSLRPDYPQVRDFIIQACPHAQIHGLSKPEDRLLNTL